MKLTALPQNSLRHPLALSVTTSLKTMDKQLGWMANSDNEMHWFFFLNFVSRQLSGFLLHFKSSKSRNFELSAYKVEQNQSISLSLFAIQPSCLSVVLREVVIEGCERARWGSWGSGVCSMMNVVQILNPFNITVVCDLLISVNISLVKYQPLSMKDGWFIIYCNSQAFWRFARTVIISLFLGCF